MDAAVDAAEALRPAAAGAVDPTPAHWQSLRLTLYQHMLWTDPTFDETRVFSVAQLHPFAPYIVSAPFFHPTPLACMKERFPVAVLLQKCVPNRCQLRSCK